MSWVMRTFHEAALTLADARIAKLMDEINALKALPSPLFKPQSLWAATQQFEREAFAKGLHHAATSKFSKD